MKTLILGSSGTLGQAVVSKLAPLPDVELRVFDRGKKGIHYPAFVDHVVGNATSEDDLAAALQGVDVVFSTLGPLKVDAFARPLVAAMANAGVQRLFWTTQFQIYQPSLTRADFELAAQHGFDEQVERDYVQNQREGADIISASPLKSTLLMAQFFTSEDTIQHAVLDGKSQPISGGPISVSTLSTVIAEMVAHPTNYTQQAYKISALV